MRMDVPLRGWTALTGVALVVVLALLIDREANPAWRGHQRRFGTQASAAAARSVAAAEEALRRSDSQARISALAARVESAQRALESSPEGAEYRRLRAEVLTAERRLEVLMDGLQRGRAEYQGVERDYLLTHDPAVRQRLRTRLVALRQRVEAETRERDRLAASRDAASERIRALTADIRAGREALAATYEPLTRAQTDRAAAIRRQPQVEQFLLDALGRVDRCTTCHVAAARPGFEREPEPLRTHVGRYLQDHPPDRFGCTVCHGGQGRAVILPAAHGRITHWPQPLIERDLIGGRCAVCHRGPEIPGEPYAAAGRRLFVESGCQGCHEVEGIAAPPIGPSLANIGVKADPAWLAHWLRDPRQYLPRTRMPNFMLPDQEVADLSAFLLTLREATAAPAPHGDDAAAVARGDALFKESRCVTCHAVAGRGGTLGPDLERVGSKVRPEWLGNFLADPARWVPGTRMPRYRFTAAEAADLAAYLRSELRAFEEPPWPAPPDVPGEAEAGRRLIQKYGCFGCHAIPTFERTTRVGAELTGYADKEVARLDFGLRQDVPRTWRAWTDTKLRDPRGFRDSLKMPDFRLTDRDRFSLVTYLASLTEQAPPPEYLREVPAAPTYAPEAAFGKLVADLNCLVCHSIRGRGGSLAPDLSREGSRVLSNWLRRFLDRPNTIRLALEERMPRFRLAPAEIETITTYIENVLVDPAVPDTVFEDGQISSDLVARGRTLYYGTYGCHACHQLGMSGGAVGPDLTGVEQRLRPGWIYAWLRGSRRLDPAAREPAWELGEDESRALTAFLLSKDKLRTIANDTRTPAGQR